MPVTSCVDHFSLDPSRINWDCRWISSSWWTSVILLAVSSTWEIPICFTYSISPQTRRRTRLKMMIDRKCNYDSINLRVTRDEIRASLIAVDERMHENQNLLGEQWIRLLSIKRRVGHDDAQQTESTRSAEHWSKSIAAPELLICVATHSINWLAMIETMLSFHSSSSVHSIEATSADGVRQSLSIDFVFLFFSQTSDCLLTGGQ